MRGDLRCFIHGDFTFVYHDPASRAKIYGFDGWGRIRTEPVRIANNDESGDTPPSRECRTRGADTGNGAAPGPRPISEGR
jgi:hypothetical protein